MNWVQKSHALNSMFSNYMKKLILIAFIISILPFKIHGQQADSLYNKSIDFLVSFDKISRNNSFEGSLIARTESPFRVGINFGVASSKNKIVVLRMGVRYFQFTDIQQFIGNNFEVRQKIRSLEIPLDLRIYLSKKTVQPYLNFNLAFNRSLNGFSSNNITVGVAAGIDYCMYDDIAFFVQPILRKIIAQNNNTEVRINNILGLEMGFKYRY